MTNTGLSETEILFIFAGIWLVITLAWFAFIKWGLDKLLPETTLRDDSAADPDSSSADRRDTF